MFGRLIEYLDSIRARDPAPRSRWEILLYPGVIALGLHRVAHRARVGHVQGQDLNTGDILQGFDMQVGGDNLRARIAKGQYRSAAYALRRSSYQHTFVG